MIIPSIDLQDGHAVQLIGGEEKALDAGDPRPLATRYGRVGEIAVIDLDAALGRGDNRSTINDLIKMTPCRVGGGIRSVEAAIDWLDKGAVKIILGTAAEPEILKQLPPERVIVALDAKHGEVVVEG
ncbi:MAG: HisA/HisF-related TIM barrel protein, partial [Geminicoccaceae bacterium]